MYNLRSKAKTPTKRTIRFQVASDLHLEHVGEYDTYDIEKQPDVDWLLLPGDIGSAIRQKDAQYNTDTHANGYLNFLIRMCRKFKRVYLVLGNNEFKGPLIKGIHTSTTDGVVTGKAILKKWAEHHQMNKRLIILDKARHDLHEDGFNVSIIGCTLWSNHRLDQPRVSNLDKEIVGNTSQKNNARHQQDLKWLKQSVSWIRSENKPGRVIIVVTHHAPCITGTSSPKIDGVGDMWSGFQSDVLGGLGVQGLGKGDVWVFGHTHFCADFERDEVRVFANQRGGRNRVGGFNGGEGPGG